jgi:methyl-accepting chemotaxis protein
MKEMEDKKTYKFGLRRKLVLFTTVLAMITYTTSALFIYVIYPFVKNDFSEMPFTIVCLLLGIIWSGILAFFAADFIIKPLKKIETTALEAANGKISSDVEIPPSDDEIRSLGIAFNYMLSSMRKMVSQIDGNFHETNETVVTISQIAEQAARQSGAVSRTINEIAVGADNSASSMLTMVELLEDASGIAEKVQEKAVSSQQISTHMVQELQSSKQAIQSLIAGMERIVSDNSESMGNVKQLEQNAAQVGQIIQLVGDIASQTNLLALNASIEAARAGEHGRGFAVVAEEVRKLADQSGQAVHGISDLIKNIQTEVHSVVKQMEAQVDRAGQEMKKGTNTNQAIEGITGTINEMAEMVKEISTLVDRQKKSIEHTLTQSQEISAISQQTSAGAQQVAAATSEQVQVIEEVEGLALDLKGQADKLQQTIRIFTL